MTPVILDIRTPDQVNLARKTVQEQASKMAFGTLEKTKFVTAASELARNTLVHGKGGTMTMTQIEHGGRTGLHLVFADAGPGIGDIEQALQDGFTTARSLGLGLGGARRLVNEFAITSVPGVGTTVSITQWKRR